MKLYFFRCDEPNFGDELNNWLMPRVLPGLLDDNEDQLLLAIGSVLFNHHPAASRKIVLGSGYGGYTPLPHLDDKWDIRCVRGPLTAQALGLSSTKVAGDTAILLRNHYTPTPYKRVAVSFIPHFQSISRGHWQAVCKLVGIRFIDPRLHVETVLEMLSESKLVITEAMHGAIVSDALRVPWVAMNPLDRKHHMKWSDWAGALDLQVRFQDVGPSSARELFLAHRGRESAKLKRKAGLVGLATYPIDAVAIARAAWMLSRVAKADPQLSADSAIARATDKLQTAVDDLRWDYG